MRLLGCSGSLDGGGSERQLWQLACHLDRQLFRPWLYLLHRRGVYLDRLPEDVVVRSFESEKRHLPIYFPGAIHRRQVRHLTRLLSQEAIQLVYDRTFHMTLVSGPACRRAGVPRVSVIVSPPSRDFSHSRERFGWWKRRLLSQAYRAPHSVVLAVSKAVAEDAAAFYRLADADIRILPSPVDAEGVHQASWAGEPAWEAGARFRVLCVGRLSAEKGQRCLLEALAHLNRQAPQVGVEIVFLGDGPDRQALQRQARELDVEGQIRFAGYVDNPYPWMRTADVLCLPSRYEGLPNVLLEALALQTPILATRCGEAVVELLGDGLRGSLAEVDDAAGLARQLLDALLNRQFWRQRAETGNIWVQEHHGLTRWIAEMQDLFTETVARHKGRRP